MPLPQNSIEQNSLLIDIATRNVITVAPADTIGKAARIMSEKRISSLVVTDERGHPLGIVTERDMLHAMQSGCQPETVLQKVMSFPVITVHESMTCMNAYQVCLKDGIRHLVIVDDNKLLLGLVSETDFRLHINLSTLAGRRRIISVMSRSVFKLPPDASLQDALDIMQAHRDICVVVAEADRPLGIITERDIVRLYSSNPERIGIPVREVMTSPVLTISQDNTINEAAERMLATRVRHLVVVDQAGLMAGLLSEHDLTHAMTLGLVGDKLIAEGAFLHTLVNTIPDLVWLKDLNGVYMACNPRFERFFGAKEKDIVGKTDYDFVDKELADFFREHDRKAMEKGGPSVNEEWITYADDGHRELLETTKTPMCDSQGKLMGVLGIARDISERRRIEEDRRRLSVALDQSEAAVALIDEDARYIYANPAFCQLFQYELNELIGSSISLLMPPEEISGTTSLQTVATAQGLGTFQGEVRRRAKDGALIPILLKVSSFLDEQKSLMGFIATMTDLTEIKRMENALRESEKHFRDVIEHAPLGTVTITLDGHFIEVNQAFCKIIGYSKEALKNLSFAAITHPDDINISLENIRELIAGKTDSYRVEKRYFHHDGHIVWAQVDTSLQRGLSGEPQCLIAQIEDITAQRLAKEALKESESKYRLLFESANDGIFLSNANGFIDCNENGASMYGLSREEIIGRSASSLAPERQPDGRLSEEIAGEKIALVLGGIPQQFEWRPLRADGVTMDVEITLSRVGLGGDVCLQAVVRDITERKRAEESMRITASVFGNSQEAIVITSSENIITDVNPAFTHITGYSREEVLGRNPKLLSSGRQDKEFYGAMWKSLLQKKAWRGEMWNRRKSGEIYAELLAVSVICDNDGRVQRYVGVFSDISYLKEHEAELSRVANYDALTGVPNRRLLADRLRQAIARAQRSGRMIAVCYIDLDGFKRVNDQYGHEAGDQLLVNITIRLQESLRAGDTLARLGGDEFVVLFNDLAREQECLQVLDRILSIVAMPIVINTHEIVISASIGVTFYPSDNEDGDTLLRHADQAMYVAKQTGKNRYHLYDPKHDQRVRSLHESRRHIVKGLESGEFELYYQPKIELISGDVVGVEALIRWHHPERGLLLPAEFLPFIEDSDLEVKLGEWVMDTAMAQLEAWGKEGVALEVSINISARHLQSPNFVSTLESKLALHPNLLRDKLQIEVLETAALEDIAQSSDTIDACRKLGVNFALDDFGTGYSSLAYLRKLSAETLKIDQTFVRGMLTDEGDRAIVQGIIALAKTFGRKTVAEGMEDAELMQVLIEVGCMYGQGFGIARPMTGQDFLKWRKERK
jgi:diguanylate cyclase (GGDEF)-like protein/PAS domain S-box-containing protein